MSENGDPKKLQLVQQLFSPQFDIREGLYDFDYALYNHGKRHAPYLVMVLESSLVSPVSLIRWVRVAGLVKKKLILCWNGSHGPDARVISYQNQ